MIQSLVRRGPLPRRLCALLFGALLLAGCGVKNPPEVPQDAGPEWVLPYSLLHGGGYRDGENEVMVDTPPPAYFPGAEEGAQPGGGVLTFPMPNQ
ncbi:hypothetical protein [Algihabitans sp.]|uniref:hypothetical protein n=1 Tax=Algihabitans sp. TaxID=2821514 RepID=UPI003BAAC1D7